MKKQKNINVFKSVWILISIFYSSLLSAQVYSGGNSSGANVSNTVAINCTANRFFGGDNEGSAAMSTNLLNCSLSRFSGDANSGAIATATNLLNCTSLRFSGDANSGATATATNLQNCMPLRFSGDTKSGATATATNLLNCTLMRFSGDTSSGAKAVATNSLTCMNMRFFGDTADGSAKGTALMVRQFLGPDTAVTLICSNETFNLITLYDTTGFTFNWGTPTPMAAILGTYTISAIAPSGCKDTAVALVKQEIIKWTGTVSNDWHTAANWNTGKTPDEKSHVIIPGGTPNPCQISNADAKAASLQVKTNAGDFSIINNRVLLLSGRCNSLPAGP